MIYYKTIYAGKYHFNRICVTLNELFSFCRPLCGRTETSTAESDPEFQSAKMKSKKRNSRLMWTRVKWIRSVPNPTTRADPERSFYIRPGASRNKLATPTRFSAANWSSRRCVNRELHLEAVSCIQNWKVRLTTFSRRFTVMKLSPNLFLNRWTSLRDPPAVVIFLTGPTVRVIVIAWRFPGFRQIKPDSS